MARPACAVALGAALAVAFAASCSKPPPPDLDGVLDGARSLPLDKPTEDALACDKRTNDCADWFRVRTKGQGRLVASVHLLADPDAPRGRGDDDDEDDEAKAPKHPEFTLELRDKSGELLQSVASEGRREAEAATDAEPGSLFAVVSSPGGKQTVRYRVRAAFEPAAPPPPPPPPPPREEPPPPPRTETRSGAVLEVERNAGKEAVLIELGAAAGMKPGLRGRLLEGGREIGAVVVQDVYPDGSRAHVEGALLGPISAQTRVEIEIPLDPPPPPTTP
jgi:hypothetical protein